MFCLYVCQPVHLSFYMFDYLFLYGLWPTFAIKHTMKLTRTALSLCFHCGGGFQGICWWISAAGWGEDGASWLDEWTRLEWGRSKYGSLHEDECGGSHCGSEKTLWLRFSQCSGKDHTYSNCNYKIWSNLIVQAMLVYMEMNGQTSYSVVYCYINGCWVFILV